MIESLEAIRKAINEYQEMQDPTGDDVVNWMRIISTHLYTLAEQRAEYQKKYQSCVYNAVTETQFSVSRAENLAEIRHPELYMLRHVMKSATDVYESLRSQLSWIKSNPNKQI